MLYLATASTPEVHDAMRAGLLGQMTTPLSGNRLEPGVSCAVDNLPRLLTFLRLAAHPTLFGPAQAGRPATSEWGRGL